MKSLHAKLILAGLISFSAFSCQNTENEDQTGKNNQPNIILITADDMGWSDLGCYGGEISTPNLDQLAHEGMRFIQFHNTSKCFPSRACLLTGVYAQQCSYGKTHKNPLTNAVTLGEVLKTAGYRTLWAGKHHGLENPYTRGFDHYYGLKDGACNHFNPGDQRKGEPKPAHKPWGHPRPFYHDDSLMQPYTPPKDFYTTDYFTDYALKWMDDYKEEDKPYFLYLAYTAPHDPLMAWPDDIARYEDKYLEGYEEIRKSRYSRQLEMGLIDQRYQLPDSTYEKWESLSDKERKFEAEKMAVYAAMTDRMDQNIGRILGKVAELDEEENTLVMFMSDNGASAEVVNLHDDDDSAPVGSLSRWVSLGENWANVSNTPFRYYKNYSYEGGINTPFIVWWPGKVKEGAVNRFAGHFIDIMPTLVEITGADYPERYLDMDIVPMQGVSFLPALQGKNVERKAPLFWEWAKGKAMRDKQWKMVKHGQDSTWNLYDIIQDPTEINDVAEQHPDVVAHMDSLYNEWLQKVYQ